MSGYEEQELTAIDAALDANPDATSNEVFQATRPYDERAIASVAVSRALAGGGGSSPAASSFYACQFAGHPYYPIPTDEFTLMPFGSESGTPLLDLADPFNPTMLVAGIYAFNYVLGPSATAPFDWYLEADIDPDGQGLAIEKTVLEGDSVYSMCPVAYVPAGGKIAIGVQQPSGSPVNFVFLVYLQPILLAT